MSTQAQKARAFQALHSGERAFVIPNPWDIGSARLLAHLGFEALATTSMGCAFSLGQRDNTLAREQVLAHLASIVSATDLPVSADLENGFGDDPKHAAETIRLAAQTGIAGGSIEDSRPDGSIYPMEQAAERVRAAAEAARALPFRFTLTGRAENYLHGRPDLKDTIARLQAYQEAGADVLYAPGLTSDGEISAVVRAVDRPVNALMGLQGAQLSVTDLSALGVKRISVGSALMRTAYATLLRAGREMLEKGTFDFARQAARPAEFAVAFEAKPYS
jgi:2-methylisocitrate lyase-like PEP mutase family enzyme